jgi:hypothetical protein
VESAISSSDGRDKGGYELCFKDCSCNSYNVCVFCFVTPLSELVNYLRKYGRENIMFKEMTITKYFLLRARVVCVVKQIFIKLHYQKCVGAVCLDLSSASSLAMLMYRNVIAKNLLCSNAP